MKPKKPCAECGHGKSKHRKHSCNQAWQTRGQTFMGVSTITKWCTCDGYKTQRGITNEQDLIAHTTRTHTPRKDNPMTLDLHAINQRYETALTTHPAKGTPTRKAYLALADSVADVRVLMAEIERLRARLDQPCHADVLLEISNREGSTHD